MHSSQQDLSAAGAFLGNRRLSRREMLGSGALGIGTFALSSLLAEDGLLFGASGESIQPLQRRFVTPVKNIILLFMAGAPGQMDTWDPKPLLNKLHGQDVPDSIAKNIPRIKRAGLKNLMASPFKFTKHGECGIAVSELLPETAKMVDDLCVIHSLHHRNPVHGPGEVVMLTGTQIGDRPSMGAWMNYGLGSDNRNLPGFVVMNVNTVGMQFPQAAGWGSGFLPARYQGTVVNADEGIRDIKMPSLYDSHSRRQQLELLGWLNQQHAERIGANSELEARIRSYELAFRMQSTAPEIFDLARETKATQTLYGLDNKVTAPMGRHCLLARRMVEAGVRFVQLRFGGWDAHSRLESNHRSQAAKSDKPVAALLQDLKQRGLLDETLVIWGGEFGRTPTMEGRAKGRDHSPIAFTFWMAGGNVRGGQRIGATDPIGYNPIERPIRPSDFHATILHALGIDQNELYYQHDGRQELVTVNGGEVVAEVFG